MRLTPHTASDYAEAIQLLLPPGAAWQWKKGADKKGLGSQVLQGFGAEMARAEAQTQEVLDAAIKRHAPKSSSWHIDEYRRIANETLNNLTEKMPRQAFTVGSGAGQRLWSQNAPNCTFPVPLVQIDHLIGPFKVGSCAGQKLWGTRARYVLRVRYYQSVVNPATLYQALNAFKQAHVFLYFEDITGNGGHYAQN